MSGCPNNGLAGMVHCTFCEDRKSLTYTGGSGFGASGAAGSLPTGITMGGASAGRPLVTTAGSNIIVVNQAGSVGRPQQGQTHNIVYQALQRPKLLRGGEWQLSVLNNLIAAAFIMLTIMTWNIRFLVGAVYFGWCVQWLIRVLGRHDPKWWQKYIRYMQRPRVREPHGHPEHFSPPPQLLPKPGWVTQ